MANNYTDPTLEIVSRLSSLIHVELSALSHEYWEPHLGADQSDMEMKFRRNRIEKLKLMRNGFENLMCSMTAEGL